MIVAGFSKIVQVHEINDYVAINSYGEYVHGDKEWDVVKMIKTINGEKINIVFRDRKFD